VPERIAGAASLSSCPEESQGLARRIAATLARRGDAIALSCDGRDVSYAELAELSDAVARRLGSLGIGVGDRVVVGLPNSIDLVVTAVAVLRAGAALVPLNPQAATDEAVYIVNDAQARLAIVHAEHAAAFRATRPSTLEHVCECLAGESGADRPLPAFVADAAPALVVYTSGTTGKPKGVVLSHHALSVNLESVTAAWGWTESDRLLLTLPCFHMHGLGLGILASLLVGSTILLRGRFAIENVLEDLDASQATMFFGVPTIYNRLVALPDAAVAATDLSRMRLWVSGSAPLSAATFERFRGLFGVEILERYGMTECGFVLSARLDGRRRAGFVGEPLAGVEIRLVDPDAADAGVLRDVPAGTAGEVVIRGANLFSGYWQRPEATRQTMLEGYLRSGDLAERDADGQFRIVGRISVDIIKTRGFKVGAGEIEDCLLRHPDVAEVAVVGVADADQGQRIIAAVSVREGATLGADELRAFARAHLAPHKVPAQIVFLAEIPRTGPGKFKKVELMRRFATA